MPCQVLPLAAATGVQEQPVQPVVVAELAVKRDREHPVLARRHGMPVDAAQDLHPAPVLCDPGGADEDPAHRAALEPAQLDVGLEAVYLAPEGIALGAHV